MLPKAKQILQIWILFSSTCKASTGQLLYLTQFYNCWERERELSQEQKEEEKTEEEEEARSVCGGKEGQGIWYMIKTLPYLPKQKKTLHYLLVCLHRFAPSFLKLPPLYLQLLPCHSAATKLDWEITIDHQRLHNNLYANRMPSISLSQNQFRL